MLANVVERLDEGAELVVGGVEVRAHAQSAARPVIVEKAPTDKLDGDGLGAFEVEAHGPAPGRVVERRIDDEATLHDEVSEEARLPEGLGADTVDTEPGDGLPACPCGVQGGDGHRPA